MAHAPRDEPDWPIWGPLSWFTIGPKTIVVVGSIFQASE